jgi:FkbM family methyltransferase
VGLNRFLLKKLSPAQYEQHFEGQILAAIQPGDCVWDVGANVGFYSKKFSQLAGPMGRVYAFEPSPINLGRLRQAVGALANVTLLPLALGNREDRVSFEQGADELGATSRVTTPAGPTAPSGTLVELTTGDKVIASGQAASPQVIKIDTEGFELDVLQGLGKGLLEQNLRVLCVEVHFALLKERGFSNAPAQIEGLLESSGFRVDWSDFSHIVAVRRG